MEQTINQGQPVSQASKPNYRLILLVVLLIILTGVLGYQLGKNAKPETSTITQPIITKSPTAVPTVDQTTDWKTYKNEEYKFEFKYPGHFTPKVADECESGAANCSEWRTVNIKTNEYGNCGFFLQFYKTEENLSVRNWIDQEISKAKLKEQKEGSGPNPVPDSKDVVIEQIPGLYNETYKFTGKSRWPNYTCSKIVRDKNSIIAFCGGINCGPYGDKYGPSLSDSEIELMLSSFKFLP